jgi:hypothetical protein
MPECPICNRSFHACGSCGLNNSWEYEYCSSICWRASLDYKIWRGRFKALYASLNDAQKSLLESIVRDMPSDYEFEARTWMEECNKLKVAE